MFEKVLVGVDERQGGVDAIALAKQLAGSKAEFTLAHVCKLGPGPGGVMGWALESALDAARLLLERKREEASIDAELAVSAASSIAGGLRDLAEDRGADLLVVALAIAEPSAGSWSATTRVPCCTARPVRSRSRRSATQRPPLTSRGSGWVAPPRQAAVPPEAGRRGLRALPAPALATR
jgi:hypothetical protein